MTRTLHVDLGPRTYPIYIGLGLLEHAAIYRRHIPAKQAMIVTNETVGPLYLDRVLAALDGFDTHSLVLPDGEEYKTLDVWNRIFDALLEQRLNRACTLLALGGGVIGDMVGFSAACYQRGVAYIQLPTTLLSQVDSSVGGKTGVNHRLGKNMIGAFYQPRCVVADTETLTTLDDRQLAAGLAEVIKYGLLGDANFFAWLEENTQKLKGRDSEALALAIERSCQAKAEVVAADEREAGRRALLNLGHTFGHAIETGLGYGKWLHGEAVAAGMCMAARFSHRLGWLSRPDVARIEHLVASTGLPVAPPPEMTSDRFLGLMAVDKKVIDSQLRLVLLKSIGQAVVTGDFPRDELIRFLGEYAKKGATPV